MPRKKKLLEFKVNIFSLHPCVSRSGAHGIFDAQLGNSASRLVTSDILPDRDTNKTTVAHVIKLLNECLVES